MVNYILKASRIYYGFITMIVLGVFILCFVAGLDKLFLVGENAFCLSIIIHLQTNFESGM